MVLEALGEAGLGQHEVEGDAREARDGEGRPNGVGNGPRVGIEHQDQAVRDVARRDHDLDAAALFRPARQDLGRGRLTRAFQLCRDRIEERRRRRAHCLATRGNQRQKSKW